jgi:cytochrome c oxidase cbb3-type subunit 3
MDFRTIEVAGVLRKIGGNTIEPRWRELMSDDRENLTGHNYDGIEEYNNPLPTWWLWTFFLTIIFGFHYWIHYEFGGAPTQVQELKQEMAQILVLQKSQPQQDDNEDELVKLLGSVEIKSQGAAVFQAKCAVCHGAELQGLIGPNLVDEYWISGKGRMPEITSVVRSGVLDKGMPAWEGQLKSDEIRAVAVFVKANAGARPANPKQPQGNKVVQD